VLGLKQLTAGVLLTLCTAPFAAAQASKRCISVASGERVSRGESLHREFPGGLELRLNAYELTSPPSGVNANAWTIEVGPSNDPRTDYMWIVTPPWGTAPHRIVGAGYNTSTRESLMFSPRDFRFVLNASDYEQARKYRDEVRTSTTRVEESLRQLQRLGKGTVTFRITGSSVQTGADGRETDFIDWFEFNANICVPTG